MRGGWLSYTDDQLRDQRYLLRFVSDTFAGIDRHTFLVFLSLLPLEDERVDYEVAE